MVIRNLFCTAWSDLRLLLAALAQTGVLLVSPQSAVSAIMNGFIRSILVEAEKMFFFVNFGHSSMKLADFRLRYL